MTSNFANIIDRCETSLNDETNATYKASQIAEWVNDAIRDYSQHFPRIKTQTINCADDDQDYDLPADFMGIISVEYPTGEDPKEYLSRLGYAHGDWSNGDKWYDILPRMDDENVSELFVSATPATGESIEVQYHAHHALISNTDDVEGDCSLPPKHQHIITKYVNWQGTQFLMMAEQKNPTSNSSLLMAQLSQNSRRLEAAYHTAVKQALYAADGESRPVQWIGSSDYSTEDSLARIY